MTKSLLLVLGLAFSAPLSAQSIFDSIYLARTTEVYFAFGSAELSADAAARLDSLAAYAGGQAGLSRLHIAAHTDSIGSGPANQQLAERRGAIVARQMARHGLPAEKIHTAGFGERRPQAPNDSEPGRQRNRRATVDVLVAVPMTRLSGQIRDKDTNRGIEALLTFRSKTRLDSARTDSVGRYSVRLPKDSVLKIEAVARNYFFETATTRIYGSPELYKKTRFNPDIKLPPAKPGAKAVVRDLFFVGNQPILLKVSEPELPRVLRFMQVNAGLRIEIAGHINEPRKPSGKLNQWEWDLSVNRAKLVYDYLLAQGIPAERMTYKGYGNTEMLFPYPGASAAEQEQNRRVEIRVVSN
jgi:outer membrane protein OmpA-like peptidoglycan-associated protein